MYRRPVQLIVYALLILQLTVMSWPLSQGMGIAAAATARGAAEHCLANLAKESSSHSGQNETASGRHSSSPSAPASRHDCCRVTGCQCLCTYASLFVTLPNAMTNISTARVLPLRDAFAPKARVDEFFRPPIA
jgi:hypothetical protein